MAVLGELDVAAKLAEFEELFKYRYTEKDDGYREALRRGSRWYQVPVMDPWPPRKPRPWKDDSEPRRRGNYRDPPPVEWDRRDPSRYRRHRGYSPPPPPGYSDHWSMAPPHPYDWHPPPHHFPPPPHLYRHRSHSPSPPSPHHHRHHHHWEERERIRREEASKHSGTHQRTDHEQPVTKPQQETDSDSQRDSDTKFSSGSGYPAIEEESAPPPSESDVMAILSSASGAQNSVTSENLKKVQKQAKQLEKKQKARRDSNKSLSERTSTSKGDIPISIPSPKSLQITHGKPQSVTANLLLEGLQATHQPFYSSTQTVRKPPKRKRKAGGMVRISSDSASSESEIDPVTVDNEPSPALALTAQKPLSTFYGAAITPASNNNNFTFGSSEPASLMVHIDNHLLSSPGETTPSTKVHSLSQTEGEERSVSVPKKKKKKKHKIKKIKLNDEYQEEQRVLEERVETATVSNEGLLKLKISLKK